MEVLSFKLWGDFGHFKKFYTTTSPLTFEFPPPATIIGIISAIIGLDKKEYLHSFQNHEEFSIAVAIVNPVKKVRWSQNLIDTKQHFWLIDNRTQIRIEFLKNPAFVIYFRHKNQNIHKKLQQHLEQHTCVYTVSLGLSELLANFSYLGKETLQLETSATWQQIRTVVPFSKLQNDSNVIDFEPNKEVFKTNYPIWMEPDRVVSKREDIVFERNGQSMRCKVKECWVTGGGEKIVFF
ncbi:type I-B CRISPR-associated protein Cas5b [Candidatus Uabimicrobium sp. HlEnr_7]|uniref:type I-B CRISPR-associated protein Cas5b n=1 Tax=Candidatus Uabimicrobium helgolandensis TaxID=3095367 RepID=UPI003557B36A